MKVIFLQSLAEGFLDLPFHRNGLFPFWEPDRLDNFPINIIDNAFNNDRSFIRFRFIEQIGESGLCFLPLIFRFDFLFCFENFLCQTEEPF